MDVGHDHLLFHVTESSSSDRLRGNSDYTSENANRTRSRTSDPLLMEITPKSQMQDTGQSLVYEEVA